jgi:hypothetical protein
MEVAVHHRHMGADQAVVADLDVVARHDRTAVVDEGVIAALQVTAGQGYEF